MRAGIRFVCALALAVGCSAPGAGTGKGQEDSVPSGGKFDSFRSPTSHGTLIWGLPNNAAFEDDKIFHAWTFTLDDEAQVDLWTAPADRVDTVMYVYRRDDPSQGWGRYIAKNDDDDGAVGSRVDGEFEAGEYRVLIKPFKDALRGAFALNGSCAGDGCELDGNDCVAAVDAQTPPEVFSSEECAYAVQAVSNVQFMASASEYYVKYDERCSLPRLGSLAMEFYRAFYSETGIPLEELYDPDPVQLEVKIHELEPIGGGVVHHITVGTGGDEDDVTYAFLDGVLQAAFWNNQSPITYWYCGLPLASSNNLPREDCFGEALREMPHDDAPGQVSEVGTYDTLNNVLVAPLQKVLDHLVANHNIDQANDTITIDGEHWESTWGAGAHVLVGVANASLSIDYTATAEFVLTYSNDNGMTYLVCE